MRINTNGEKVYRNDLYEHTAERFSVGTKSGDIDAACEFSTQCFATSNAPPNIPI